MGLDLGVQTYKTETTDRSWPKCARCTERFEHMAKLERELMGIELPYPVESFGILTREAPSELKSRYKLVVEAKCHGATHRFVMECPRRWGLTAEQIAFGHVWAFVPGVGGRFKVEVRRGVPKKSPILETSVR